MTAMTSVLLLFLLPLEAIPSVRGQSVSQESCVENPNNPVLNDSAGYTYTTSTGKWFAYNNTYQEPSVMAIGGGMRMWYAGYVGRVWGIYTANSRDGANWTIDPIPVLTKGVNGSWDGGVVYGPSVMYNGTKYLMFFTGNNGTSVHSRSIGLAFSPDGVHWKEYASNPVLRPGPGVYDSAWIKNANVILRNGTYEMWYAGSSSSNTTPAGYRLFEAIDFATSNDGVHWTKYPGNPVFLGALDQVVNNTTEVGHPDVLMVNGTLLMLYGDGNSIRYALSFDGIRWTAMPGDLVNSAQSSWKSAYVSEPAALLNGTEFALWYYGSSPIASQSSPYIEGIGLAHCGLVVVQVNTTTTTTLTSTLVQTVTSTTTVVSATTMMEAAAALPFLEGTTVVGAALSAVLIFLLFRMRKL